MKAVAVSLDITPDHRVELGAHPATDAPFSIADTLEANILILIPTAGLPVVLVSLDLLYVGPDLEQTIVAALPGVPRENILITATHTHFAPMTDRTKPGLGTVDRTYLEGLQEKLVEALQYALKSAPRQRVTMRAATGQASHSINRRLFKRIFLGKRLYFNQMAMAPNREGTTDETITLVSVDGDDGDVIAYFWNYACHPVSHPEVNVVSAHYPGVARAELRQLAGLDVPVLFFQGFSGNTRPNATTEVRSLTERIRRIVSGPIFGQFFPENYQAWTSNLSLLLQDMVGNLRPIETSNPRAARMEFDGEEFAKPSKSPVSFQAIQFENYLSLIGVSGEVVAEYADTIRAFAGTEHCMLIGCLDTPFGYIPTSKMQDEGGYEAAGYFKAFSLSELSSTIETKTNTAFRDTILMLDSRG